MRLSDRALTSPPSGLAIAGYGRSTLTAGIVHIGVSNFHRSHQAMYLDRLIQRGESDDWAIWGVTMGGRRSSDLEAFRRQDCLYSLTEKRADGTCTTSVIGSIIGIQSAATEHDAIVARMAHPATRIISLTITEGGYGLDPATGRFSGLEDPRIAADLSSADSSRSWLGLLVHALRARRDTGAGPVTLMSCDNIPENGRVTRDALTAFAGVVAPDLLSYIDDTLTFPGSMVDRVTPATGAADHEYLRSRFDLEDDWVVTCEPFTEWALEDDFAGGRPDLGSVGVELVADVHPHERMKLRLANGTHQALCFFGTLVGHTFVHEAVADPDIHAMLLRYIDDEAVPTLSPIAGLDLGRWARTVLERFGNPQIRDRLSRICAETSDRIPKFLLPVIRDNRVAGRAAEVSTAVIAGWARYAQGIDEHGRELPVVDPRREAVMRAARADVARPGAFLELHDVFGGLSDDEEFVRGYAAAAVALRDSGARAFVRSLTADGAGVRRTG